MSPVRPQNEAPFTRTVRPQNEAGGGAWSMYVETTEQ